MKYLNDLIFKVFHFGVRHFKKWTGLFNHVTEGQFVKGLHNQPMGQLCTLWIVGQLPILCYNALKYTMIIGCLINTKRYQFDVFYPFHFGSFLPHQAWLMNKKGKMKKTNGNQFAAELQFFLLG